jgi:RNA polymerase sporulation-specific sigma factor
VENYGAVSDEVLITRLRSGETEIMDYILEKYKNVVKIKARRLYLMGGETDDLVQEGMIGLYKAIRDFDVEKQVSFSSFADLCISRQIYTAINTYNRKKHGPLNSYISLYSQEFEPSLESQEAGNPEMLYIDSETAHIFEEKLVKSLSRFEKEVLGFFVEGVPYTEIGKRLNKSSKAIDNAIQRIRGKAAKIREVV